MKNLLLIATFLVMGFNAHAKMDIAHEGIDKGNGGSGSEAILVGQQAQLESVALKLRSFFLKNEAELKTVFPEFDIQVLAKKIKMSDIRIVNEDKLIDMYGKDRTCLNFFHSSLIECKSSEIERLLDQPTALFVLVLHEYLGLIGVEETSPKNPTMIDGYKISKRIASFITKVNEYDLVFTKKISVTSELNQVFCSTNKNDVIDIVNTKRSINTSIDELMMLRNITQDKEQINYYEIKISNLRAEYLKCDLFLKHALLNNQ